MARQGAPRERTAEAARAFWNGEAADLGGRPQVTIRDLNFRLHERHTLLALIPGAARLLDAGCVSTRPGLPGGPKLPDWRNLGHQRLIVARAI
jgi:hypothetical protein